MEYVLGFLFDNASQRVALILKTHPEWQEGKFNGLGGKIRDGEPPVSAMRREFFEEAGVGVLDWEKYHEFREERRAGWIVHCFRATHADALAKATTMTDEPVSIFWAHKLPENLVEGVDNLVTLALANPAWRPHD